MLNHLVIIGRLCADPELRYTQTGTPVARFTLAVDRTHKSPTGQRETDFIPVVVWQKLGELVAQHLKKGRLVAASGRLQLRSYESREGQKVRVAELVASDVQFLDVAATQASSAAGTLTAPVASGQAAMSSLAADGFEKDVFIDDLSEDDLPF